MFTHVKVTYLSNYGHEVSKFIEGWSLPKVVAIMTEGGEEIIEAKYVR